MVCSLILSSSSNATAERSAPIADRPTSVITETTWFTVSASASIEVACCSLAVRSAAADKLLGQPAAHLLGLALAGDVDVGPDPFGDLAAPPDRHRADVVVPVPARLRADPVGGLEGPVAPDGLPPLVLDA